MLKGEAAQNYNPTLNIRNRLSAFWSNVVEEVEPRIPGISPCWTWIGPHAQGYGMFSSTRAIRVATALYTCEFPAKVMVRCSNRRCVRLEHLNITLAKDKPIKVSKVTGRPIPPPIHKDERIIKKVLADRFVVAKSHMDKMAKLSGTSRLTVKKILLDAPIYDMITEVKALKAAKKPYQTSPHKRVGSLLSADQSRFDFIKGKQVTLYKPE